MSFDAEDILNPDVLVPAAAAPPGASAAAAPAAAVAVTAATQASNSANGSDGSTTATTDTGESDDDEDGETPGDPAREEGKQVAASPVTKTTVASAAADPAASVSAAASSANSVAVSSAAVLSENMDAAAAQVQMAQNPSNQAVPGSVVHVAENQVAVKSELKPVVVAQPARPASSAQLAQPVPPAQPVQLAQLAPPPAANAPAVALKGDAAAVAVLHAAPQFEDRGKANDQAAVGRAQKKQKKKKMHYDVWEWLARGNVLLSVFVLLCMLPSILPQSVFSLIAVDQWWSPWSPAHAPPPPIADTPASRAIAEVRSTLIFPIGGGPGAKHWTTEVKPDSVIFTHTLAEAGSYDIIVIGHVLQENPAPDLFFGFHMEVRTADADPQAPSLPLTVFTESFPRHHFGNHRILQNGAAMRYPLHIKTSVPNVIVDIVMHARERSDQHFKINALCAEVVKLT